MPAVTGLFAYIVCAVFLHDASSLNNTVSLSGCLLVNLDYPSRLAVAESVAAKRCLAVCATVVLAFTGG